MNHDPSEEDVYDYGLFLIDKIFRESNRALKDWPAMPQPQKDWDAETINPLIAEQLDYAKDTERKRANQKKVQLNPEQ
ncbi:hypothetical protein B0H16DRAFT_1327828, partial [Mycena metata]